MYKQKGRATSSTNISYSPLILFDKFLNTSK